MININIIAIGKGKKAYFIDKESGINYGNYCPVCKQVMKTSNNYDWTLQNHVKTNKHQMNCEISDKNEIIENLNANQDVNGKKIEIEISKNLTTLVIFISVLYSIMKIFELGFIYR